MDKTQYGSGISKAVFEMILARPHGVIIGKDGTHCLCGTTVMGEMVVYNRETGQGYFIDFDDVVALAETNNWADADAESGV